jgi:P4 family phage/plasmid primase-like protien
MTWPQLATMLSEHERRSDKDCQGWSPITYKPGTTRANKNVVEVSAVGADFDHKSVEDYQDIRAQVEGLGLTYTMYSTWSCEPDELAFRMVIPFTKPVPAAQWSDVWHRVNEHVFGGQSDPQTKDTSRMFFRPACPPDGLPFAYHHDGLALDPDKLPAAAYTAPEQRNGTVGKGTVKHLGYATYEFITFGAEVGHQRGAALAATRACLAAGHSTEEAAGLVWKGLQASPVGDPENAWTYEDALAFAEDLANREPTPLPRRPIIERAQPPTTAAPPGGNGRVGAPSTRQFRRKAYHRTDTGNAERLVDRHGPFMRFCHPQAQWYVYDTRRWARDQTGAARQRAKETVRSMLLEAYEIEDDEKRKELVKWAFGSESADKISALLKQAQSEPGIPVLTDAMDQDPWLFNCLDGTINLKNGALRPHDPADTITKLAPVHYDPDATCPRFDAFLERIIPDANVRAFLQRAVGYSLTGETSEQCLLFLHGSGANGKSTFLAILQELFGDYGCQAAPELLEATKTSRHPTELADLFGARLVATIEVDEGRQMAESLVKQMTGGDRMKARFMRENFFEFSPTHKIFLAANHKPAVRGDDEGIWRRIHLVPFGVTIPAAARDKNIVAKLRQELPGILHWALRGCLQWQNSGLGVPEAVARATASYRAEQDALGAFLSECCVVSIGEWVPSAWLRECYENWCKERGDKPLTGSGFGDRLRDKGCETKSGRSGDRVVRGWAGVRLKLESEL